MNYFMLHRIVVALSIVLFITLTIPQLSFSQEDAKKKEELLKKLEELKKRKAETINKAAEKMDGTGGGASSEIIAKYERLYQGCKDKKNDRCADVMYTLCKLYYDKSRDDYIKAREDYEVAMKQWEKNKRSQEPVNPLPDYSRALKFYQASVTQYPEYEKADEGYYQIGTIQTLNGNVNGARDAYNTLVDNYPSSPRASAAHFRLSEFCYLDRDFTCALKHLEKIKFSEINPEVQQMAHYRKAEIYYNRGDFDKAADLFFDYVLKCDRGEYPKKDLRDEALEFLAISFSDMPDGANKAYQFMKSKGKQSFEDYVVFEVGLKNFNHGQYEQALSALRHAIQLYPYYKDAPTAQQNIVACFVIRKKYDEANAEREKLISLYNNKSDWYTKNSSDAVVIEKSRFEMRKALGAIAIYLHAEAQKTKNKQMYEKALKRYQQFVDLFPEDKWKIYEYKFNMAEIYNYLREYAKAAENYDYVAQQNLSAFPKLVQEEFDTMGMEQEEIERVKQERKKAGVTLISQDDAGYNAIVALDNLRKQKMQEGNIAEDQSCGLTETQQMLSYISVYDKRFTKSQNTPEVLYIGGNLLFGCKRFEEALVMYKRVVDAYSKTPFAKKAQEMMANTYASIGNYPLALNNYKQLMASEKPNTPEYMKALDLAAGALFKKATDLKKSGNIQGAIDAYKNIAREFPTSNVADGGWFEVGVIYEEQNDFQRAADVFKETGDKFPNSKMREKIYVRAAENYKKVNKFEDAGKMYSYAASQINKPDFAIPSFSAAAEAYKEAKQFDKAGAMYELILAKYPTDARTPAAIYNGGLMYEKGKLYDRAIKMYQVLSNSYKDSEYAPEAMFSIGLNYEKMGDYANMAKSFKSYADQHSNDRSKQVEALLNAAKAYKEMDNTKEAENTGSNAISIIDKFKSKQEIDINTASKAFYTMGDIKQKQFSEILLKGKSEREIASRVGEKTKALEPVLKYYAGAIELGVGEWTIRSAYNIGQCFVEFAQALKEQQLFGTADQKLASRIKIIQSLDKYYAKALEKFQWNITTAYDQGIANEWVSKSQIEYMRVAYLNGRLFEQIGEIFKSAPLPSGLSKEDKQAYKDVLEEKYLESLDAALPKYEASLQSAKEYGLVNNPWVDSVRARVSFIKPSSEALQLEIAPRVPKVKIGDGKQSTPPADTTEDGASLSIESTTGLIQDTTAGFQESPVSATKTAEISKKKK